MKTTPLIHSVLTGAVMFSTTLVAFGQGILTPPGAPAPTMKTLDQVYDRIGTAAVPGDTRIDVCTLPSGAFGMHAITQPGSYYLSTNILGVTGGSIHGISIVADNVTLDLNGFSLLGNGDHYSGISMNGIRTNINIRSGIISGWGNAGISCDTGSNMYFDRLLITDNDEDNDDAGIYAFSVTKCVVKDCFVMNNGNVGIACGDSTQIIDSMALDNGNTGCWLGENAQISGSAASGNANAGFSVGEGSMLDGCISSANTGVGMALFQKTTVDNCVVRGNSGNGITAGLSCVIKDSSLLNNGGNGLTVDANSLVKNCSAQNNTGSGIDTMYNCQIVGCTASGNTASGIFPSENCLIKDCLVTANGYTGINMVGAGSSVIDCVVKGSLTGYGISSFNKVRISGCTVTGNNDIGISATDDSTISGCTSSGNGGHGILVRNRCTVERNVCNGNTSNGIYATEEANRIDGNQALDNDYGIVLGLNMRCNLVVRNMARNRNTLQRAYVNIDGTANAYGPFVDLSGGQIASATGWENFEFYTLP